MNLLPNHITIKEYAQRRNLTRKSVYDAITDGRITPDTIGETQQITLIDWKVYAEVEFRPSPKNERLAKT